MSSPYSIESGDGFWGRRLGVEPGTYAVVEDLPKQRAGETNKVIVHRAATHGGALARLRRLNSERSV